MPIKKYLANSDNVVTNKFIYKDGTLERNTGSNAGAADIVEVFSLYGRRENETSQELARTLIKFPVDQIISDRSAGTIPDSGSVTFKLKLYNAKHFYSLPFGYDIQVAAISSDWQEGFGVDLESYGDTTKDQIGSNWMRRSGSTSWSTPGGDYHTDSSSSFTQHQAIATKDLDIDITELVEQWMTGSSGGGKDNYGVIIKLTDQYEAHHSSSTGTFSGSVVHNPSGSYLSYYTKMYFGRGTEFFYKRPVIEAQYTDNVKDDRGKFYFSSSAAPAEYNLNSLYMYNYIGGKLRDIGGSNTNLPTMKLYYSSGSTPEGTALYFRNSSNAAVNSLVASRVDTGIYKASFSVTGGAVTTTYPYIVDVWSTGSEELVTGSAISPIKRAMQESSVTGRHIVSLPNLMPEYHKSDIARIRMYVRKKNWSPNIYTVAKSKPDSLIIVSGSYRILRTVDGFEAQAYGTGSVKYSDLSYDGDGNYFDINMDSLEAGFQYTIKVAFYDDHTTKFQEQPYDFKFRVVE